MPDQLDPSLIAAKMIGDAIMAALTHGGHSSAETLYQIALRVELCQRALTRIADVLDPPAETPQAD